MPRILTVSMIALMTALLGIVPSSSITREEIISRLQKKYDETIDFKADFFQETHVKAMDRKVEYKGQVYFKKPGKMRWNYSKPKGQTIVADGKFLWFYQPADKQVIKASFDLSFQSNLPVSFLTGVGNIERDFVVQMSPQQTPAAPVLLKATPRREDPRLGELELMVDSKTFEILEARIQDLIGNLTTIRLANVQRQVGIDDKLFSFNVPKGVEVIEAGW